MADLCIVSFRGRIVKYVFQVRNWGKLMKVTKQCDVDTSKWDGTWKVRWKIYWFIQYSLLAITGQAERD